MILLRRIIQYAVLVSMVVKFVKHRPFVKNVKMNFIKLIKMYVPHALMTVYSALKLVNVLNVRRIMSFQSMLLNVNLPVI